MRECVTRLSTAQSTRVTHTPTLVSHTLTLQHSAHSTHQSLLASHTLQDSLELSLQQYCAHFANSNNTRHTLQCTVYARLTLARLLAPHTRQHSLQPHCTHSERTVYLRLTHSYTRLTHCQTHSHSHSRSSSHTRTLPRTPTLRAL